MMRRYPYYIVITWRGRLADQVPFEYRGTVIEKQFKNGRIGGKRSTEQVFEDPAQALQVYNVEKLRNHDPELYEVAAVNRPRRRIMEPVRELTKIIREQKSGKDKPNEPETGTAV